MAKIRVDRKQFDKLLREMNSFPEELVDESGKFFVNNTPIRSGNARNKTRVGRGKINADYPYAARLDEGWSKQAPNGMVEPTLKYIEQLVRTFIRNL